jgi:hypothetical protein
MSKSKNMMEVFKKYEAKDVKTVEELLNKYSKTFNHRTKEYHDAMLESHTNDLERLGYTFVNYHDSTTGNHVAIFK